MGADKITGGEAKEQGDGVGVELQSPGDMSADAFDTAEGPESPVNQFTTEQSP